MVNPMQESSDDIERSVVGGNRTVVFALIGTIAVVVLLAIVCWPN